ncbi:hypothetical protein HMPREF9123_2434 [Neisseria bacilliformis ATCC BAA-1200]|uniref:Uncharacterized protein n=1 Tax=Neisseria bacilliformis ATCC BAA-1200 TaxID=888742 RepID=F2BFC7_9NEIS|nr:hypothetical protein HMPREF9123_2434 [Neisseria bacilliformis ATCC BAA-1200]
MAAQQRPSENTVSVQPKQAGRAFMPDAQTAETENVGHKCPTYA